MPKTKKTPTVPSETRFIPGYGLCVKGSDGNIRRAQGKGGGVPAAAWHGAAPHDASTTVLDSTPVLADEIEVDFSYEAADVDPSDVPAKTDVLSRGYRYTKAGDDEWWIDGDPTRVVDDQYLRNQTRMSGSALSVVGSAEDHVLQARLASETVVSGLIQMPAWDELSETDPAESPWAPPGGLQPAATAPGGPKLITIPEHLKPAPAPRERIAPVGEVPVPPLPPWRPAATQPVIYDLPPVPPLPERTPLVLADVPALPPRSETVPAPAPASKRRTLLSFLRRG
ncbi:hypothetical protein [Leifsonia sp. Leaf264]|uniref:hypothetical protein n=1 Tax=Leifsonia sp. Leaf264 TaxID=1736314 RepID=UPI0006FB73ED|nr:hypothetical protein [Leifsonia sp. Leaf264]KQO98829.1 hypothetical protein ASF30_12260 [Leifsonia sp. Leaf264]